jgi:hypothetical protein
MNPTRTALSRRAALQGLVGAAGLACGARPPPEEEPDFEYVEPPRLKRTAPPPTWPDGPAPELVLAVQDGGTDITWYADGTVLRSHVWSTNWGSPSFLQMPALELWHVDAAELERLRGLIAAPEVLGAASTYRRSGLKDGGYRVIAAGSRRIYLIGAPSELPAPLAELAATYHRMFDTFEAERVDGFLARGPHLLAVHERSLRGRPFADRLVVFGNGVLEYRVTHSDAPKLANGDDPDPQIRLEVVPLATLTALRDVLAAPALSKVPSHGAMNVESGPGTSHMFAHAGAVPRIRLEPGEAPHADLRPLLAALSQLRERFAAPPDEA